MGGTRSGPVHGGPPLRELRRRSAAQLARDRWRAVGGGWWVV